MEVVTCRMCGKIYNRIRGQIVCPACQAELDGKFKEAKDYLYKNPRTGVRELAEHCEVPISQINRWIREERLCFTEDSPITLNCEACGVSIRTGRFCARCKTELQSGLNEAAGLKKVVASSPIKEKKENKMRFLDS